MALSCIIRQSTPFRTRIRYRIFLHQPGCCRYMEEILAKMDGVATAQVRPRSGSVVLVHPDTPLDTDRILALVQSKEAVLTGLMGDGTSRITRDRTTLDPGTPAGHRARYHVSGAGLVITGTAGLLAWAGLLPAVSLLGGLLSLASLAALWLSLPIQRQALDNFHDSGHMDMGMVSTGVLYYSLATGSAGTALAVSWLFNLSGWMETRIRRHTCRNVREMLAGRTRKAWLVRGGAEVEVDAATLEPGHEIRVRQGNTIPVDGRVTWGEALVSEAAMTGESMPAAKQKGAPVMAGTLVMDGDIRVCVEKAGDHTRLAAIIRLIESADTHVGELGRASLELSRAMVPVSLLLASTVFLATGSLLRAMTVLMVVCPCALRLSTSVAVSTAMGRAAAQGILIKGGEYVETAGRVNVVVLDKTGTLTGPESRVTGITPLDRRFREETLLRLAAGALKTWHHPMSRAVAAAARERGLTLPNCECSRPRVGQGFEAVMDGRTIRVGSQQFMAAAGIRIDAAQDEQSPESLLYMAENNRALGIFHVSHPQRPDAGPREVARLRGMGISCLALLTGDSRANSSGLQWELGLDEVCWGMSPEDKAQWIYARRQTFPTDVVAMLGDGINDTPAFSKAHLALAVGESGEDVTLEYADIVLQQGSLAPLADTLALGRETLARIKQSYAIAVSLNLAILGLLSFGLVSPVAGALLHNLTTVLAVANAAKK